MPTPQPARLLWTLRGLSTAVLFIGVLLLSDLPLLGGSLITIGVLAVRGKPFDLLFYVGAAAFMLALAIGIP